MGRGTSQHADYDANQGEVNRLAQKLAWLAQKCPHPSSPKYDRKSFYDSQN